MSASALRQAGAGREDSGGGDAVFKDIGSKRYGGFRDQLQRRGEIERRGGGVETLEAAIVHHRPVFKHMVNRGHQIFGL